MRATEVVPAGRWNAAQEAGQVLADFEQRHRRRLVFTTQAGWEFLLDLRRPARMRDGDGLVLEDRSIVRVVALAEDLLDVTSFDDRSLTVIAWHLGNRHLPVQILRHSLRVRAEGTTEDLLERLGATITPVRAAFDPEPGAYEHG
jgi:urease accessory protein